MPQPTLSFTEFLELSALNQFLVGVLPAGVPAIRGQVNRVAEPANPDFVVYWPIRQSRLSTNITSFFDNIITGSISGTTLTVSSIVQSESPLTPGLLLLDGTIGAIAPNTVLGAQLSGSIGGTGTYGVLPSQSLGSETLYLGQRADQTPAEWVVQLDCHGPNSGDNIRVIEGLFRSEYAVDAFNSTDPTSSVVPLWSQEAIQTPFLNAEQQYENRWTLDLHCQITPTIGTAQQFAQYLQATLIDLP